MPRYELFPAISLANKQTNKVTRRRHQKHIHRIYTYDEAIAAMVAQCIRGIFCMHVRASLHGWTWLLISANLVVFVLVLDAINLVRILAVKRGVTFRG